METIGKNLKAFAYSLILFALLTLAMSAVVRLTAVPESWSVYYMIAIVAVCCFFLGLYIGNFFKKRGFAYGALYSVIFILLLSAFYMLAFSSGIDFRTGMLKSLIPILFGSVGGMIGVNMQN